ncbi:hypothetical protein [Lacticaseibacillus sharpeae]|uniref:Uncharacterized protein n=1 Tax=Lacticaseibacillus sharpeae JCM 1186 = DSM 20505 TaxID=1291052 RepID=A0A0R1ZQ30_9LACO|nr:hypothetical protein [Lacticaseibacillus sharpeae]KRM56655.1 hypothetical protein FC18_GL001788 [Lacticaseibacillus sharpeae JCM 1186 = DSM 20505]
MKAILTVSSLSARNLDARVNAKIRLITSASNEYHVTDVQCTGGLIKTATIVCDMPANYQQHVSRWQRLLQVLQLFAAAYLGYSLYQRLPKGLLLPNDLLQLGELVLLAAGVVVGVLAVESMFPSEDTFNWWIYVTLVIVGLQVFGTDAVAAVPKLIGLGLVGAVLWFVARMAGRLVNQHTTKFDAKNHRFRR